MEKHAILPVELGPNGEILNTGQSYTIEDYLPKNKRKKILLITDDIRVHSGVAQIGREIVLETCHHYNWCCIAGAVQHPEFGKMVDLSDETGKLKKIPDPHIHLYPAHGYGEANFLKQIINHEKPDAILLITDPRYFVWLFSMENEIRKSIPIAYLNIWDDFPAPQYNEDYYESCDLLMGISKQTKLINEIVLGDKKKNRIIDYVPHGLNSNIFSIKKEGDKELEDFMKKFNFPKKDFTLLFNSRNIRRKQIPDTILAWRLFTEELPPEERKNVQLVLHTDIASQHGTDLGACIDYFNTGDEAYMDDILLDDNKYSTPEMNCLYNMADGVILLSSAEGWGLSLTEAMLTGTPFIANVTGGMQDQMRFVDKDGNWFTPSKDLPSNHRGTIKEHGEWALPVYPTSRSIQGSIPTPYIFDDRCEAEDAKEQIMKLYKMSKEERKRIGKKGYDWATGEEAGFTSKHQAKRVIKNFNKLFETWKPREKFEFIKDTEYKPRVLKHKLIY